MTSGIQVTVCFKEQGVFAGEEVQSIITFKNVASVLENTPDSRNRPSRGWTTPANGTERPRPGRPGSQNPRLAAINGPGARKTFGAGHRTTSSLNMPLAASAASRPTSRAASPATHSKPSHSHQRSVSIISLGSPAVENEELRRAGMPPRSWPMVNRSRAVSTQSAGARADGPNDGETRTAGPTRLQMPVRQTSVQGLEALGGLNHSGNQMDDASSASASGPQRTSRQASHQASATQQVFKFPSPPDDAPAALPLGDRPTPESNIRRNGQDQLVAGSAKTGMANNLAQPTRVLAGTSATESNRSSGDFQSFSNHSQETLASEQASNASKRPMFPSPMVQQHYRNSSTARTKRSSETILMGYAQTNATFVLDGSLVDRTPFEEVKRKGFLGGQGGGGVVGVKTSSNTTGLLAGFNLNSLGESLSGLLGATDLSSTKEMRGVTSSRTIPLLSTPQSLLFVDLTLLPGQEKSFLFRCTLPRGLPASYKGKAIKINYHLNVGVQVAPGDKAVQTVRRVNIPFKVFSGVNDQGEIFGHDLMQPYVILEDAAYTRPVSSATEFPGDAPSAVVGSAEVATQGFLTYVDTLLNSRRRRQSSSATLDTPKGLTKFNTRSKAKGIIDSAIFFSKQNSSPHQSSNRFEIARNGRRVATIFLERNLHRLGESVTVSVDVSKGQLACYSLRCSLETTENVNPALALRSAASITRLSRRVYQSQSESTLFAERVVFSPSIPVTATPTLLTSGVNLDWALRFEFVTARATSSTGEGNPVEAGDILEEVANDGRGYTMAAVETLQCETFEVSIPITVYGETLVAEPASEGTVGVLI